ncbi:hypothetical protein J2S43_007860 [Catenuloplanes nepalensis]|uniref:Head-to-tail stopper n=1 Tax=Catenuloplanes nepalensis TaxID=587533 RepID=A0ABT9N6M5_9ACTN|nr:hypothetical protein [Catenuloplanes nepalensis]MDP9799348.1 hypothetical protein [Catenuloplanes nepalensis]
MTWEEFIAACGLAPATITVEAYEGAGAHGDVYAPAAEITPCIVEAARRRVSAQTQDAAGAEVLSSTTIYCPPGTVVPPGSRVTAAGRTGRVIAVADLDAHGLDLPAHVELSLE